DLAVGFARAVGWADSVSEAQAVESRTQYVRKAARITERVAEHHKLGKRSAVGGNAGRCTAEQNGGGKRQQGATHGYLLSCSCLSIRRRSDAGLGHANPCATQA